MSLKILTAVTAGFVATVIVNGANAQDQAPPHCGSFAVIAEVDGWTAVDHGEEGDSTGDVRLLRVNLLDHDGEPLGVSENVITLLQPAEDGSQLVHNISHHMYDNGAIAISTVTSTPNTNSDVRELTHTLQRPVLGGTGEYAHATGIVTTTTLDDGRRQMAYDLRCDP